MTDRKPTSYSEKLVKHFMKTGGCWYRNKGPITDLVTLHDYFENAEFIFLIELIYEAELGTETIVRWAEEVRQTKIEANELCLLIEEELV